MFIDNLLSYIIIVIIVLLSLYRYHCFIIIFIPLLLVLWSVTFLYLISVIFLENIQKVDTRSVLIDNLLLYIILVIIVILSLYHYYWWCNQYNFSILNISVIPLEAVKGTLKERLAAARLPRPEALQGGRHGRSRQGGTLGPPQVLPGLHLGRIPPTCALCSRERNLCRIISGELAMTSRQLLQYIWNIISWAMLVVF